jgi:hypothetical protein
MKLHFKSMALSIYYLHFMNQASLHDDELYVLYVACVLGESRHNELK